MNHVIIKLINDKEIIGTYMAEDDYVIWIKDPLEVQSVMDINTGTTRCMLGDYMPFAIDSETGIPFPKLHMIQCLEVKPTISKYYINSLALINKNKRQEFEDEVDQFIEDTIRELGDENYIHKTASKAVH